jgi:hypothetical protein
MNQVIEPNSPTRSRRIRPSNELVRSRQKEHAIKRLQGHVCAVMLRHTERSKLDGQSLIELPTQTTERADVAFNDEPQSSTMVWRARCRLSSIGI